jgi:hypothetical protein
MSPFDKARYDRLLKGLEVTEVLCSEVMGSTETSRIDPEYFNRDAIVAQARIGPGQSLGGLVLDGYRVVYETTQAIDRKEGERLGLPYFLQAADISTPFIHAEGMICVPEADWIRYPKGRIKPGELLIEVKGKAEKVALVPDDFPAKTLVTGTCFKLTTKRPVDRYFLAAYLISRYGQALKDRLKSNLLVAYIAKDDLYGLPVPQVSDKLKRQVQRCFESIFTSQGEARTLLGGAEQQLQHALGLDTWTPPEAASYVRSSGEAFAAGRLDAEHFQPRFAALAAKMAAMSNCNRLGSHLRLNARGRQPEYADEGLPVINSKHVLRNEVHNDDDNRRAVFDDDSLLIQSGDVLINGTGVGTIGRAATYLHVPPALPDNHVTVLRPTGALDPVYLAIFMNSLAGQLQVEQRLRGSSGQIELYPTDIAEFQVWVAPNSLQLDIRKLVEQSFVQRQRATRLLDAAKRTVEIAIEDSEKAALAHLAALLEVEGAG